MTDTYNDTTGSRKKFLIPLVVLLLCAVSLTGAGYAYNSSVSNDGNANVDQSFVIDLYTTSAGTTPITDVITAAAAPLVVTTAKVIGDDPALTGKIQYDETSPVIYTGYFKITKQGIDSTKATLTAKTVTATVVSSDDKYAVTDSDLGATLKIYQGDNTSAEVAPANFEYTIGSVYCFEILMDEDYTSAVANGDSILDAKAYAEAAIAALSVEFNISLTAQPVTA